MLVAAGLYTRSPVAVYTGPPPDVACASEIDMPFWSRYPLYDVDASPFAYPLATTPSITTGPGPEIVPSRFSVSTSAFGVVSITIAVRPFLKSSV